MSWPDTAPRVPPPGRGGSGHRLPGFLTRHQHARRRMSTSARDDEICGADEGPLTIDEPYRGRRSGRLATQAQRHLQ